MAVESADFFEKTIKADPNLDDAHLNLAVCLFKLGCFSRSLEHVERVLILKPGQPQALSHKGELKRFYGDYDAALKLFERCLQATPDNPVAKRGQAFCLIEKGDRLGYALLVLAYKEELRELKLGESIGLIDIGWERTLAIGISNVDGVSYQIKCDGLEIYVPKSDNSYIGIGVVENRDASLVPIIVKRYDNLDAFIVATNAIAENVMDSSPISVTGSVQNQKNHREIRIEFPQYTIYGKTNPGAQEGFNKFCEAYDGVAWLILECGQSFLQWKVPLTGLVLKG
ncbi:tetratricopeptide repeat protein [Pseudomonas sp. MWU12-2323]|uniref:tetratricopeptide repeat protein n=2 Tax=Pseudomonas TaxID=286 RepID=UPI0015B6D3F6|nr:tetratricopeptide repeat protein [Pseudomonas sp. MWU12-2323]